MEGSEAWKGLNLAQQGALLQELEKGTQYQEQRCTGLWFSLG